MIMARALEKASKNMLIERLDIQYNTETDEVKGYLVLSHVVDGRLEHNCTLVQIEYEIHTDGTICRKDGE